MLPLAQPFEFYRAFIEWYVVQVQARSYLEIGCADGNLVERVSRLVQYGVGVDVRHFSRAPLCNVTWYELTSDAFWVQNDRNFDVIFIDGDHSYAQTKRDLRNALACLNPDGLILMHDTYPPDQEHTLPHLCGSAWRTAQWAKERLGLEVFTFPVTYGLTLVRKTEQLPWMS